MTTSSNSAAAAHTATTKLSAPNTHCLDPLSAAELSAARATAVAHLRSQHGVSEPRFSFITLHESSTQRLSGTSGTRVAEVVVHLPPTIPHVLLIHLDASTENEDGSDNDISAVVASDVALPAGTQPPLTPDDCELAEQIALKDDTLRRVVAKSGLDIARVVCDPWSVHMADDIDDQIQLRSSPSSVAKTEAGANGAEGQDMRLVQLFLYYRLGGDADAASIGKWNHYSHPLYWVPLVDLASRTVVTIHGTDCADLIPEKSDDSAENAVDGVTINAENASNGYNAIPPLPTDAVNYTPETLGANTYLSKEPVPRGLKRLEASQPDGASFTLSGHTLVWDQWNLHVGFNYREGVVIHDMKFGGRSIAARASLVEMAVPYADPRQPFQRKCAFDVSDYGLGYCTTSLQLNCDCVGHIAYMDATLTDTNGEPYVIPNAVCIHEEDAGTACKHVEYRTGVSYTRRARRLVVSFVATVVNYEYLFYFWFHVDGSWGLDIKLSGMLSTNLLANDERAVNPATGIENGPSHGTLVAPGVNAQWHQHMFCARVEPAVDGALNCVSEFNVTYAQSVANGTGGDRFGNAFGVVETPLSEERQAVRDNAPGRWWRVFNQAKRNEIARKPVGYKFAFKSMGWMPNLLASDDSVVGRRARFAQHNVWVTKWRETQRFPAGEFPTQGTGVDDGEEVDVKQDVKTWVEDSEERLVDERLVLWLSFGVVHVPRVEDFPVMPCEEVGFVFKPDCFMLGNPVVDMDEVQARDSKSLCCGNGEKK